MKYLKIFENFESEKKFVVIGTWIEDGKKQWDVLSPPGVSLGVSYEEAVKIKIKSGIAWTNNNDLPEEFKDIKHEEIILTLAEYQKMLDEDEEYQEELLKNNAQKYNI